MSHSGSSILLAGSIRKPSFASHAPCGEAFCHHSTMTWKAIDVPPRGASALGEYGGRCGAEESIIPHKAHGVSSACTALRANKRGSRPCSTIASSCRQFTYPLMLELPLADVFRVAHGARGSQSLMPAESTACSSASLRLASLLRAQVDSATRNTCHPIWG